MQLFLEQNLILNDRVISWVFDDCPGDNGGDKRFWVSEKEAILLFQVEDDPPRPSAAYMGPIREKKYGKKQERTHQIRLGRVSFLESTLDPCTL